MLDGVSGNLEFPNHNTISDFLFSGPGKSGTKSITSSTGIIFPKSKLIDPEKNIRLSVPIKDMGRLLDATRKGGIIEYPIKVILRIRMDVDPTQYHKYFKYIKHIDDNWEMYNRRAEKWWSKIKPMLMSTKETKVPGKIALPAVPKTPKPPTQMKL